MPTRQRMDQRHGSPEAKRPADANRVIGYRKSGVAAGTGLSHYVLLEAEAERPAVPAAAIVR